MTQATLTVSHSRGVISHITVCNTVSRKLFFIWTVLCTFTARADRYNHELETDDDEDDDEEFSNFSSEFSNFSTCSPRYSRICASPVPSPSASPGPSSPVSPNTVKKTSADSKDSGEEVTTPRSDQSSESSPMTVRKRDVTERLLRRSESRESDEDFRRQRSDSGVDSDKPRSRTNSTNEWVEIKCDCADWYINCWLSCAVTSILFLSGFEYPSHFPSILLCQNSGITKFSSNSLLFLVSDLYPPLGVIWARSPPSLPPQSDYERRPIQTWLQSLSRCYRCRQTRKARPSLPRPDLLWRLRTSIECIEPILFRPREKRDCLLYLN